MRLSCPRAVLVPCVGVAAARDLGWERTRRLVHCVTACVAGVMQLVRAARAAGGCLAACWPPWARGPTAHALTRIQNTEYIVLYEDTSDIEYDSGIPKG